MLPRMHRLRHRRDFNRVYRDGLRQNNRHLTLRALNVSRSKKRTHMGSKPVYRSPLSESDASYCAPPTQIGISISTKVSKRAVIRNRIKRQIKAAMFSLLPRIASNWLIVISVRPEAIECDYWQFLRELEEMIKNLR